RYCNWSEVSLLHFSLAAKRRYSARHYFLTCEALRDRVNQTPRNRKESLCGTGVMIKLLSTMLKVYGEGANDKGSSLLEGSRLQMKTALLKLILVLLKL